jgi:hypothetical protein
MYYSEVFKQQLSLAKSSGQEVLHSHVHPLRYIFNFFAKLLYMNREITEKHLGEDTWCFRNGGKLTIDDISILISSMSMQDSYDSNLLEKHLELLLDMLPDHPTSTDDNFSASPFFDIFISLSKLLKHIDSK